MKHLHTFESFVNEAARTLGSKAKKFTSKIKEYDFFSSAVKKEEDNLPDEWYAALKNLGIKSEDAVVCFFDAVGDRNKVLDSAKLAGLKYVEVEDGEDGGSGGIVFSAKQ